MKTPITPLRMPLELKKRAKEQAEKESKSLSQYIFRCIECDLAFEESIGKIKNDQS